MIHDGCRHCRHCLFFCRFIITAERIDDEERQEEMMPFSPSSDRHRIFLQVQGAPSFLCPALPSPRQGPGKSGIGQIIGQAGKGRHKHGSLPCPTQAGSTRPACLPGNGPGGKWPEACLRQAAGGWRGVETARQARRRPSRPPRPAWSLTRAPPLLMFFFSPGSGNREIYIERDCFSLGLFVCFCLEEACLFSSFLPSRCLLFSCPPSPSERKARDMPSAMPVCRSIVSPSSHVSLFLEVQKVPPP